MLYTQKGFEHSRLTAHAGDSWQTLKRYGENYKQTRPAGLLENDQKRRRYKATQVRYFIAGEVRQEADGTFKRGNDSLVSRDVLVLDYDDIPGTYERFKTTLEQSPLMAYGFMVYPTTSHTNESPRLRLLVPLERPADRAEYLATRGYIVSLLAPYTSDEAETTWSQLQGLPVHIPGGPDLWLHDGPAHPVIPAKPAAETQAPDHRGGQGTKRQQNRPHNRKRPSMDDLAHFIGKYSSGIDQGGRDNWLTGMAGTLLKRDGVDLADARDFLHGMNRGFCSPPLDPEDVDRIFFSIAKSEIRNRKGV